MSVDKEIDRFLEDLEIGLKDDKGDLNVRGVQYPGSYGGMAFVKDDVQPTMELIPVDDSMNRVLVQPDSSGQLMVEGAAPSWQKQSPYESINLVRGVEAQVPDMVMMGQPAYGTRVPDMVMMGQPAVPDQVVQQAPQPTILRDREGNPITASGQPIMIPRQANPAVGGGKGATGGK